MGKLLVTGATGTVGSEVVNQLVSRQADFRVLVRSEEKAKPFRERDIDMSVGRFEDTESLAGALENVTAVFLLSPPSKLQVKLESNLVDSAKKAGVQHIVKVSALGASPDSNIHLARWHAEIEAYIEKSGMNYTFLRPHSFMQNLFNNVATIKSEAKIYAPMEDGAYPMVDVRDIAAVAAEILTGSGHYGKVYHITGPEAITMHDVAEALTDVLGKKITYVPITPEQVKVELMEMGLEEWFASDLAELGKIYASGKASDTTDTVRKLTGRKGITIQQFVRDYADVFSS